MEDATAGFDDWEILPPEAAAAEAAEEEMVVTPEAEVEAEGLMMLRLDYFSIDDDNSKMMKYSRSGDERSELSSEGGGSVVSDNPSWIDPAAFPLRNCSGEFWPDSASDRSKLSDSEEKLGSGFVENNHNLVYEMESQGTYLGKLGFDASVSSVTEGLHVEKMTVVSENHVEKMDVVQNLMEDRTEVEAVEDGKTEREVEQPVHVEKKALLWLKLPIELVKFCVFRISPVWSISVAAAMLGVFIIRRRLHMMKRKTKGLQMKVTMDDKVNGSQILTEFQFAS